MTSSHETDTGGPLLHALEGDLAGKSPYPNGTVFLRAELPDFGPTLSRCLLEGDPIVVIYPDGRERLIETSDPQRRPANGGALRRAIAALRG